MEAQGFGTQTLTFSLDVSQVLALNFKVSLGVTSTTVEVTDAARLVETSNARLSTVIDNRQMVLSR